MNKRLKCSSPTIRTMDSPARQNWTGTGWNRIDAPPWGDAIMKKHECLGGKIFGALKLQQLQLFQLFVIKILNNPKYVGTN